MADREPTMEAHLAHGSWGMVLTTMQHDEGAGSFCIGVCDVCHLLIATCNHESSTWVWEPADQHGDIELRDQDENGMVSVLRCDLCGIDGT